MSGHRWRLRCLDEVGSTSTTLAALARAGEPDGLAILARTQTAGRGSNGRSWLSPHGSLALSVLLRPATAAAHAGHWSLLAGLATIEALGGATVPAGMALKWPNDIMLGPGKLAGILIDSATTPDGRLAWLVVGIGANLAQAPAIERTPTASLAQIGLQLSAQQAAQKVLDRLDDAQILYQREGFAPIRAAWLAHAHPIGTPLTVLTGQGPRHGTFAGLTDTGALLLQTPDGTHAITSAAIQAHPAPS